MLQQTDLLVVCTSAGMLAHAARPDTWENLVSLQELELSQQLSQEAHRRSPLRVHNRRHEENIQPWEKPDAERRQQDHTTWAIGSPAAGSRLLLREAGASMDQLVSQIGGRSSTLQQQAMQLGQAMQQRGITVRPASCVVGNA